MKKNRTNQIKIFKFEMEFLLSIKKNRDLNEKK